MRPTTLSEFVGQRHILQPGKVLRNAIESDQLASMILWGPPGVGKTTLARIIARVTRSDFHVMSAVTAGVKDIRKIIEVAEKNKVLQQRTVLFIDEIHRFNKAQQDALLHSVEDGTLLLIGATTENPGFEVNQPLLSRCQVYKLYSLSEDETGNVIDRALNSDKKMREEQITLNSDARTLLISLSGGDARTALTALELAAQLIQPDSSGAKQITAETIHQAVQKRSVLYDKKGDYHYDVISAFIKSVRGSDPDAALYWLAHMVEAGEDPLFIARRLVILASEDIGNADPHALMVATSAFQAVNVIGMPEARLILAQATTYLASAQKSNASYLAINQAQQDVQKKPAPDVPLHLRNAPTRLMKQFGYGEAYQYPHDHGGFIEQSYFPENRERVYYRPTRNGIEAKIKERLQNLWPRRKR
ncbi:MAG: replication-associated recombination protein A [candidate division KSB1 bacterium]|nr:replication-associated recombination protein A [candidate division KSB1 bacterium]